MFKKLKQKLDYNNHGGALFLGVNKAVIKAHGSSKDEAFKNAVLQAYENCALDINEKIGEAISLIGGEQ